GQSNQEVGQLTVSGAGVTLTTNGSSVNTLARDVGSAGSLTVDAATVTMNNNSVFYVGDQGTGTLTIQNSGHLFSAGYIEVAESSGAGGSSITISGSGSTLSTNSHLLLGRGNAASLN